MAHIPLSRNDIRKVRARWGASSAPRTWAKPLLPAKASEQDWLEARREARPGWWRIGASEIAAVLDVSPHTSAFALWWAKQATWARPEPNDAMVFGHKLEKVIGEIWAERHPETMLCRPGAALYGHREWAREWLVCTPDFLAVCESPTTIATLDGSTLLTIEPVECKSDEGGKGWGKPGTDEVPFHHKVQVYVQCEILGASRGHLMRLAGKKATSYVLPYDDAAKALMDTWCGEAVTFLQSLRDNVMPDIDGHPSTTDALQHIHAGYVPDKTTVLPVELANDYRHWHAETARVKEEFETVKNQIRAALGDAQTGLDGEGNRVVRRTIYKKRGYEVGPQEVDELRRLS